jgi:UrcA family protein
MFALNKKYRLATGAALAVLLAFTAKPAAAGDQTRSELVSAGGLDLTSAQDQAVLRHRLLVAAGHVCSDDGDNVLDGHDGFVTCRKEAFDNAWAKAQPMIAAAQGRSLLAAVAVGRQAFNGPGSAP